MEVEPVVTDVEGVRTHGVTAVLMDGCTVSMVGARGASGGAKSCGSGKEQVWSRNWVVMFGRTK